MGVVLSAIKWDWALRVLNPLRPAANHGCFRDPNPFHPLSTASRERAIQLTE
ncbi:MAG: hypothetical protein ABSE79_04505 [Terriglobia bacterium]|jgi:hypothetical protein